MIKKIGLTAISLILLMIAIWYMYTPASHSPVYSNLAVSEQLESNGEFQFGSFQLNWNSNDRYFSISPINDASHNVFSSPIEKGFLAIAHGKMTPKVVRGHFSIKEKRQYLCQKQTISNISVEGDQIHIKGHLTCPDDKVAPYIVKFTSIDQSQIQYDIKIDHDEINRIYFSWLSDEDERFFGFGEQYSTFDMKGKRLPILVQEQGIGRGAQPITFLAELTNGAGGSWSHSYAPVPQYISSKMRSLYSENNEYQIFHFKDKYRVQLEVFSNSVKGKIYNGKTPADLVEAHTEVVGRMRALPDWTQEGLILGAQGGSDVVQHKLNTLLNNDVPISGLWIQDWVGQRKTSFGKQLWWNWELDQDHYANWDTFKKQLDEKQIHTLGYVNPFIVDTTEKDNVQKRLYEEAKDSNYLILNNDGNPLPFEITSFDAFLLDLTNDEAREWMKNIIKEELLDRGFSGWMADFGEALPLDTTLANGDTGLTFHNQYPVEWAKLNQEVLVEANMLDDAMFFSRAGFSESPGYTSSFWLGDQLVTWDKHDGIKTAVTGLLSSGLSGYSLNHSDIGGYTTITNFPLNYVRKKELMLRWIELNAFTSLFRSHEGNRPEDNIQLVDDGEVISHVSLFGKIFKSLAPYRKELMIEAETKGIPVVRPLFFHYPYDENTYDIQYEQFMLGENILVAPVLDKGKEKVDVYLPEGKWVHLWSQKKYDVDHQGTNIIVDAPIGEPGIFYHKDSNVQSLLADWITH